MAESYNAIAIKMGIDTSQFDAGLRRTQKQIDDVAARMAKASEENRQRARMAQGMGSDDLEKQSRILSYLNKNWEHHLQVRQRLRVVRNTEIADQIRANELAAIYDRQLAKNISSSLTLNKIYNQQAEALARRTSEQEVAQAERLFQVETSRVLQSQELVANEERIRSLREDILARAAAEASRLGEEQKVAQAERLFQVETSRAIKSEEQLANEERIRTLREDILARAAADANRQAEEQERLAAVTEARVQIRKMLNDEEEKTNALLAFRNKQRRELLALQKQLDAAGIQGSRRKRLIQEFQTLQAATKAEWEKANAQKYVTDLERKAEAVKDRLITAEQRHAATLVDLKNMLQQNLLTQGQYAAAVKQTDQALAMQKGGFGRMAGAATQASFAIEDFVQVMSMGGGLNMALMSASNNVTMVIRSLNLFKGTLGTVAMFGLPLLAVGVTSAIGYFTKASKATDRWKDALEELERTWKNSGWREMARLELKDFGRQIEGSSSEQLTKRENDLLAEQEKIKAKLFQQDLERTRKNQELFMGLVGGQEAYAEMLEYTNRAIREGSKEDKQRAIQLQDLMAQAQKHAIEGRAENTIASLREMLGLMEEFSLGVQGVDITMFDGIKSLFNDPAMMDALQSLLGATTLEGGYGFESDIEQLNAFKKELLGSETDLTEEQKRQLQITDELLKIAEEKQKAVEREIEAAERLAEQQKKALDAKRQEMMFDMTASDLEKAAAEIERQRQEFVFGGMEFTGPTLDQIKANQDFLLAVQRQTEQRINELKQVSDPAFAGALQQDAFKAQAEAFKQMDQARQEKRNPQLDQQIELLRLIKDALSKGTPLVLAGGP